MKGCDVKFQGMLKGMLIEMQRVDYCQLIARSDIRGWKINSSPHGISGSVSQRRRSSLCQSSERFPSRFIQDLLYIQHNKQTIATRIDVYISS
jgi:hypothetical protein